jgi:hypothetical protein
MMTLLLFMTISASGVAGYVLCKVRHERRHWKCVCELSEECKARVERLREDERQREVDSRRYVLTEGVWDR